jgi:lipoteichoic acid synthase
MRTFIRVKVFRSIAALVLTGLYLIALRSGVFVSSLLSSPNASLGHLFWLLPLSLSFEALVVLALCGLCRVGRPGRWVSRALLAVLLWTNCVGTVGFFTMRTYVRGFQLGETNVGELWTIGRNLANPVVLVTFGGLLALALLFGREGSIERRPLGTRQQVALALVGVAALIGVVHLYARPAAIPTIGSSPVALLLDRSLPNTPLAAPPGSASQEDWAPVTQLQKEWAPLAAGERQFNVVVLVMESTRASSFWPSAQAPALPHVAALAPHALTFTRAYAHEPLSLKAFEALEFGTYPDPSWELGILEGSSEHLDSVSARWRALGMKTALIQDCLPLDRGELAQWGFSTIVDQQQIQKLDPLGADRTLVRALDQFVDDAAGQQFGAILWTRETHFPYDPARATDRVPKAPRDAYQSAVGHLDDVIADLTALLERRHLADNTVLVLVGDHGEAFSEHPESGSAHGAWLFEESTHIPMMLINPRLFHGERDGRLVQQKDLAATLTWLAGDARANLNQGACLFYARDSETAYLTNPWDVASLRGAVVRGNLKYMFAQNASDSVADERLYDLTADPGERNDLWRERAQDGLALRTRFFGWLAARRADPDMATAHGPVAVEPRATPAVRNE